MPAPGSGPRQAEREELLGKGEGVRNRGKILLKSQTKAIRAKCRSQHNSLREPNYHNDVKEPNQQSGA